MPSPNYSNFYTCRGGPRLDAQRAGPAEALKGLCAAAAGSAADFDAMMRGERVAAPPPPVPVEEAGGKAGTDKVAAPPSAAADAPPGGGLKLGREIS